MKLPTHDDNQRKGRIGINIVKNIVENEIGWLFRANHNEDDFGIDGFIDIILGPGQITGKSIAVQIKTGQSYFTEKGITGWIFRDRIEHLNYFLNHDLPVIILLVNEEKNEVFWEVCNPSKTIRAGSNWKIEVPFKSRLNALSKNELLNHIGPIIDYVAQLEHFWAENETFKDAGIIMLCVDNIEICTRSYNTIIEVFNRFKVNLDLICSLRGKVDITIYGYDNDNRELYEIPEVVIWVQQIIENIEGLPFFLSTDITAGYFLRVIQFCNSNPTVISEVVKDGIPTKNIELDVDLNINTLESIWENLNYFCENYNIPREINKEISLGIIEYYTNEKVDKEEWKTL
jgi:hypothetical protein